MNRNNRATLIKLGAYFAAAIVAGGLILGTLFGPPVGDTTGYVAYFEDSTGLRSGDQVRASGIPVGEVTSVELVTAERVRVRFSANGDQRITSGTWATIRYADLLGTRYLALSQPDRSGEVIPPGGQIVEGQTRPALSLTALFNGFRPLFAALDANQVNQLSEEIINVLQGQGGTISSLLRHTASLTSELADRDEVFGEILASLSNIMRLTAKHDSDIASMLGSLNHITASLNANGDDIVGALAAADGFADRVARLLAGLDRNHLTENVANLTSVVGTLAAASGDLDSTLKEFPNAFTVLNRITQNGNFVNAYACAVNIEIGGETPTVRLSDVLSVTGLPPSLIALLTPLDPSVPVPLEFAVGAVGDTSKHSTVCSR